MLLSISLDCCFTLYSFVITFAKNLCTCNLGYMFKRAQCPVLYPISTRIVYPLNVYETWCKEIAIRVRRVVSCTCWSLGVSWITNSWAIMILVSWSIVIVDRSIREFVSLFFQVLPLPTTLISIFNHAE